MLQVGDGQVLLMDAGCEYHGYVSDVTRTWPVIGRYTAEQRQVYETVLEVRRR
jgi:Xaa-Pro aminopeptidase